MTEERLRILIVDDDEVDRLRAVRLLRQAPDLRLELSEVHDVAGGVAAIRAQNFDCVLLDFRLPDGDALDLLKAVEAEQAAGPPIVIQTVMDDERQAAEALARGAQDYLVKGRFDSATLLRTLRYAIQRDKLVKERNRLARELQSAQERIQTLEGILPICSFCKRIRSAQVSEDWEQVEAYVTRHSHAVFSHGICPDCLKKHYPDFLPR